MISRPLSDYIDPLRPAADNRAESLVLLLKFSKAVQQRTAELRGEQQDECAQSLSRLTIGLFSRQGIDLLNIRDEHFEAAESFVQKAGLQAFAASARLEVQKISDQLKANSPQ